MICLIEVIIVLVILFLNSSAVTKCICSEVVVMNRILLIAMMSIPNVRFPCLSRFSDATCCNLSCICWDGRPIVLTFSAPCFGPNHLP